MYETIKQLKLENKVTDNFSNKETDNTLLIQKQKKILCTAILVSGVTGNRRMCWLSSAYLCFTFQNLMTRDNIGKMPTSHTSAEHGLQWICEGFQAEEHNPVNLKRLTCCSGQDRDSDMLRR